ncbi:CASP-like protein [Pyrus ussuriensis x Pyrus communis]|uniref:CASP-like protein n=1 Tax=Pyrus ussuriensis x Pyrus communis TaxID=2448454 RepID=A0A5N5GEA7_9ROSA|nr:CASP-like protein [Pyrus ussuriensis x Pyrus communis]
MRSPPQPHRNGGDHPFHSTVSLRKLRRFSWNEQICSGSECNNGATLFSPRSSTYGSIGHDQKIGVCYAFVEYEDIAGVHNALKV